MQINVYLDENIDEQAARLRRVWFPTTTAMQTRSAFIFNECIDRFQGNPDSLLAYLEKPEENGTVQRKVTIKSESNDRLKTLAAAINKTIAATYRAIIAYTVDHLPVDEEKGKTAEPVGLSQIIMEKLMQLEKQMEACNQTIREIKELTKQS